MRHFRNLLIVSASLIVLSWSACLHIENTFTKIPPGPWRAVLQLEPSMITANPKGKPLPEKLDLVFEEVANGELPFTFEVSYTDDTTFVIDIINGKERIRIDDIAFGHTRDDIKDTIRIDFPVYDSYVIGKYENGLIEGDWVVNYREDYSIPFIARFGDDHRFTKLSKKPIADLSGSWAVTFGLGGDDTDPYPGIGEFVQNENNLTGTFRTETGDYRFLEGTVQGDKVYLSVFDGSHAFLFEAKVEADGESMVGSFRSGTHYRTIWKAKRDDQASLKDPNELTYLTTESEVLDFAFPSTSGDTVRLSDEAFSGKVKLIQIMGTWCPNCMDETDFLLNYLSNHPHPDLQLIAVGFERYRDQEKALGALMRFQNQKNVPYPVLWGGYYNKKEAVASFPMLNHILSYPTLLFVDRDNRVRQIHTGFNGPATSKYDEFVQEFTTTVNSLLDENIQ